MRGALAGQVAADVHSGFIPAYAGSTCLRRSSRAGPWVHPRVCGEHIYGFSQDGDSWGSSPRMRGAPRQEDGRRRHRGFIPAYAGSTFPQQIAEDDKLVHPRVCGEHQKVSNLEVDDSGSSPRMRGALEIAGVHEFDAGFIPAYAGSTRQVLKTALGGRVHPRVCGEHSRLGSLAVYSEGSSPRMRGAR